MGKITSQELLLDGSSKFSVNISGSAASLSNTNTVLTLNSAVWTKNNSEANVLGEVKAGSTAGDSRFMINSDAGKVNVYVDGTIYVDEGVNMVVDWGDVSTTATASKIVQRDASGYIYGVYINSSRGDEATAAASYIYDSGDGWLRKKTLANAKAEIVTYASASTALGFTSSTSSNPISGPDNLTNNGIAYVTGMSLFGQVDGALYTQAYSSSWVGQIYQDYRTGQLAVRGKNNGVWTGWRTQLDSSNYTSYSPSLTGSGASGSWGINITGSAATATSATSATSAGSAGSTPLIAFSDGPRDSSDRKPNTAPRTSRFDFMNAAVLGGTIGNYTGVMTFTPWDGLTSSTGDCSYQLAFASTSANGGNPRLAIRNGIDTTWNAWKEIYTSANLGSWNMTATAPAATTRLNYDGYLYATRMYGAVYNDYAEYFEKADKLEPGDVVATNPDGDGYIKSQYAYDNGVVGVYSDDYAHCIGGEGKETDDEKYASVGMAGRVRVKVIGPVKKNDLLVASDIPGIAMVYKEYKPGTVIAKVLENNNDEGVRRIQALILNM